MYHRSEGLIFGSVGGLYSAVAPFFLLFVFINVNPMSKLLEMNLTLLLNHVSKTKTH